MSHSGYKTSEFVFTASWPMDTQLCTSTADVVGLGHLAMVDLGIREVSRALTGRAVTTWLLDALTKLFGLCHQKEVYLRTRGL